VNVSNAGHGGKLVDGKVLEHHVAGSRVSRFKEIHQRLGFGHFGERSDHGGSRYCELVAVLVALFLRDKERSTAVCNYVAE
jgi:hypothetical protein